MNTLLTLTAAVLFAGATFIAAAELKDSRVYEMRIYHAAPGKLDALNARFRDHTVRLFEKHGIENIGYWTPIDNTNNLLIYVLRHASRDAARKSFAAFGQDPEWKAAAKASEANGKLVAKIESYFMEPTDYSPVIKSSKAEPRVFELREYTASEGNLAALDARFRDHTVGLFSKHGMQNIAYWHLSTPTPSDPRQTETLLNLVDLSVGLLTSQSDDSVKVPAQKLLSTMREGAVREATEKVTNRKLIYIIAHKSKEAAVASFAAFRNDPDWVKARAESEKKAGGSLTEGGMSGVRSTFMKATDYSATK
jgi:hypothetical protein